MTSIDTRKLRTIPFWARIMFFCGNITLFFGFALSVSTIWGWAIVAAAAVIDNMQRIRIIPTLGDPLGDPYRMLFLILGCSVALLIAGTNIGITIAPFKGFLLIIGFPFCLPAWYYWNQKPKDRSSF